MYAYIYIYTYDNVYVCVYVYKHTASGSGVALAALLIDSRYQDLCGSYCVKINLANTYSDALAFVLVVWAC